MGGGFGIHYRKHEAMPAAGVRRGDRARGAGDEVPTRARAGPLHRRQRRHPASSRVLYTKESGGKHFVIQDAAMNDLIRPTLYDSFHRIWPVSPTADGVTPDVTATRTITKPIPGSRLRQQDVVGPVCESGDFLAKDRPLPSMKRGDLLARLQRRRLRHGDGVATTTRRLPGGRSSRYRPHTSTDPPPRDVRGPRRVRRGLRRVTGADENAVQATAETIDDQAFLPVRVTQAGMPVSPSWPAHPLPPAPQG